MSYSVWNTAKYKGRKIETIRARTENGDPVGVFWIVDGDLTRGYRSGKDAKSAISGVRPRWGFVNLSTK